MKQNKNLLVLFIILMLMSCATKPIETKIITKPVEIEIYQPPLPYPLVLEVPYFHVVTKSKVDELFKKLHNNVFIAISVRDYEKLAKNLQESRRYRLELMELVNYYRKVTQPQSWEEANDGIRKERLKPTENTIYEIPPSIIETIGDIVR